MFEVRQIETGPVEHRNIEQAVSYDAASYIEHFGNPKLRVLDELAILTMGHVAILLSRKKKK